MNNLKIKNEIWLNLKINKNNLKNKINKKNEKEIKKIFQAKLDFLKNIINTDNVEIYSHEGLINEKNKNFVELFLNDIKENPEELRSKLLNFKNLSINNLFIIFETILTDVINDNKINKYINLYNTLKYIDINKYNNFSIIIEKQKNLEKIFWLISKNINIKRYLKKIIEFFISKFNIINLEAEPLNISLNSSFRFSNLNTSMRSIEFENIKNNIILNEFENKTKTLIINNNNPNYEKDKLEFKIRSSNKDCNVLNNLKNWESSFDIYILEITKYIIRLTKKFLPNEIKIFFTVLKEKYYNKNQLIFKNLINFFLFQKLLCNMIIDNFFKVFIIEKNLPNFNKKEYIHIIKYIIYKIKNDESLFLSLIDALSFNIDNLNINKKKEKIFKPFSYFFYSLEDLYHISVILKNEKISQIVNEIYKNICIKTENENLIYKTKNIYFITIVNNCKKSIKVNKTDLKYDHQIINELIIYFNNYDLDFSNKDNFIKKLNNEEWKNFMNKENSVIKKKLYYIINDEKKFELFKNLYINQKNHIKKKIKKLNLKLNNLIGFNVKFEEKYNNIIKTNESFSKAILKDKFFNELNTFVFDTKIVLNLYKKDDDFEKIHEHEDYLIIERTKRKSSIFDKVKSIRGSNSTIFTNYFTNNNERQKVYLEFFNLFEFFSYIRVNKIFDDNLLEKKNKNFFKIFKKIILEDYFNLFNNELNYDKNFIYRNYIKFISICFNSFMIRNYKPKFNTFNDYLFYTNCKIFNFLEVKDFLEKTNFNLKEFNCNLNKFQKLNSFYKKMASIKKYQSNISQTLEILLKNKAVGNEQIFPISLKWLLNEKPKNLISNYKITKLFLGDKLKNGIDGFLLTQIKALINMIQKFNHKNVKINKNLFNEMILKNEIELSIHFKKKRKSDNKKKIILENELDVLI